MEEDYPGINRLHYFLSKVGMIVAVVFVVRVFGPNSPVMKVLSLLLMVAGLILDVMRLRNIGLSQWYALIRFFPFGNTVFGYLAAMRSDWLGRNSTVGP